MSDDMEPSRKVRRIRVIGKLTKDGKDKEVSSKLLPTTGFKTLRCNPETGRLARELRLPDERKQREEKKEEEMEKCSSRFDLLELPHDLQGRVVRLLAGIADASPEDIERVCGSSKELVDLCEQYKNCIWETALEKRGWRLNWLEGVEGVDAKATFKMMYAVEREGKAKKRDFISSLLRLNNPLTTTINPKAFKGCKSLAMIKLPDKVTHIGEFAFTGCESLALKKLPGGVTKIGYAAFMGCKSLALKELPDKLTHIEENTFAGCTSLALKELPKDVTEIREATFMDCTSLALKELPGGVTKIGYGAFMDCKSLALKELPDGVTEIGNFAFLGCKSLALKELPKDVTEIGYAAFKNCTSLALEKLPEGVTEIGEAAFRGCTSLSENVLAELRNRFPDSL